MPDRNHPIRLHHTGPINPFLIRDLHGKHHDTTIQPDGKIHWEDLKLTPSEPLPAGTEVRVTFLYHFTCETLADIEAHKARIAEQEQQKRDAEKARLNLKRDQALTINAQIQLSVPWVPAIKAVLSGLSSNSWGDGTNRATVHHILLQADFQQGRIKRKQGDFLCTSQSGSNGQRYVDPKAVMHHDGDGKPYPAQVTCKACLRLSGVQQ